MILKIRFIFQLTYFVKDSHNMDVHIPKKRIKMSLNLILNVPMYYLSNWWNELKED